MRASQDKCNAFYPTTSPCPKVAGKTDRAAREGLLCRAVALARAPWAYLSTPRYLGRVLCSAGWVVCLGADTRYCNVLIAGPPSSATALAQNGVGIPPLLSVKNGHGVLFVHTRRGRSCQVNVT